jgi:DNA-binding response OmpR family regulator
VVADEFRKPTPPAADELLSMLSIRASTPISVAAITQSRLIAQASAEVARRGSFVFQALSSVALGVELARSGSVALLIVDLRVSGVEQGVLEQIRSDGFDQPLVCVGAGPRIPPMPGADEVISANLRGAMLVGRIAAWLRSGSGVFAKFIRVGALELEPAARRVTVGGRPVRLTPAEYALLLLLLTRAGKLVSKEEILLVVLASQSATRNAYFHVHNLKTKLGSAGAMIQTVWGNGYRLSPDQACVSSSSVAT